jgi:hypothetical protein
VGVVGPRRVVVRRAILLVALLILAGGMIVAGPTGSMSGKELLNKLNSKEKCDNESAMGYVAGVYGVYKAHPAREGGEASVAAGVSVDNDEMKGVADVAKKYLESNPERLGLSASKLLVEAFEKAFPKKEEEPK